jgi:hypothetical protein
MRMIRPTIRNRLEYCLNKKETLYYPPAKRWSGFLFRSPKAIITVERKGQTRNWLIIASLPAGQPFCGVGNNEYG